MNGLQTLRTAFWSLTVSLGVLSLLFILCPEVTQPVVALFSSPAPVEQGIEDFSADESLVEQADDEWHFPVDAPIENDHPQLKHASHLKQTAQLPDQADEFEQFVASQQAVRVEKQTVPDPTQQLQSNGNQEIPNEPGEPDPAPPAINQELHARLESLQAAIDRLAQAEVDRKSAQMERVTEQLEYRKQSQRLRELEQQLQRLQVQQLAAAKAKQMADEESRTAILATQTKTKPAPVADDDSKRFSLQIRRAGITEVLELLGQATGYNIVIGEGVGGTVPSANLRDVTIVEALDSIIESLGLVFEQEGQFIYVMTETEQINRRSDAATTTAERDGPAAQ